MYEYKSEIHCIDMISIRSLTSWQYLVYGLHIDDVNTLSRIGQNNLIATT